MPNVEIAAIRYDDTQPEAQPFTVRVEVENHETVAPILNREALCSQSAASKDGHRVEVTLTIRSGNRVVYEETKEACAVINGGPVENTYLPNAEPEFRVDGLDAGEYSMQAEVTAIAASGSDASDSYGLAVEEGRDSLNDSDGESDTGDLLGGGGDGGTVTLPDAGSGGGLGLGEKADAAMLVAGLLAVAWLASSAEGVLNG